jgi:hypothetical protein
MNALSPQFLDDFAHCLGSSDWLPFVTPVRYRVVKPAIPSKGLLQFQLNHGKIFTFYFRIGDQRPFGHLLVSAPNQDRSNGFLESGANQFVIEGIDSGYAGTEQHKTRQNLGREFVRRAVLFADQRGYAKVTTSIFIRDAASFWLGLGFRSDIPVEPSWSPDEAPEKVSAYWRKEMKAHPDSIWRLARSQIGRQVLCDIDARGILDLGDKVQRRYAFQRLKLNPDCSPRS